MRHKDLKQCVHNCPYSCDSNAGGQAPEPTPLITEQSTTDTSQTVYDMGISNMRLKRVSVMICLVITIRVYFFMY